MTALQKMTLMVRLFVRARRAKMSPGSTGIVGLTGRAHTEIAPEGTVFVRGELWRARSRMHVRHDEYVLVTGIDGLTLAVEVEKDDAVIAKSE
ncbi:MAG: NfeD family protein [Blastocatellia bacterium]